MTDPEPCFDIIGGLIDQGMNHIIVAIADYAGYFGTLNMACVSKMWNEALEDDEIWKRLFRRRQLKERNRSLIFDHQFWSDNFKDSRVCSRIVRDTSPDYKGRIPSLSRDRKIDAGDHIHSMLLYRGLVICGTSTGQIKIWRLNEDDSRPWRILVDPRRQSGSRGITGMDCRDNVLAAAERAPGNPIRLWNLETTALIRILFLDDTPTLSLLLLPRHLLRWAGDGFVDDHISLEEFSPSFDNFVTRARQDCTIASIVELSEQFVAVKRVNHGQTWISVYKVEDNEFKDVIQVETPIGLHRVTHIKICGAIMVHNEGTHLVCHSLSQRTLLFRVKLFDFSGRAHLFTLFSLSLTNNILLAVSNCHIRLVHFDDLYRHRGCQRCMQKDEPLCVGMQLRLSDYATEMKVAFDNERIVSSSRRDFFVVNKFQYKHCPPDKRGNDNSWTIEELLRSINKL